MKPLWEIPLASEKTFQQCQIDLVTQLLAMEVDLVVLSKEVSHLVDFSGRIAKQSRELRQSVQEQELRI